MPARRGKVLRAQVAALDEWHLGRVPAARFHPPAVGFPLFCGEGAFPRPSELCDWSMVPGAACWRAEAEVRPGGVGVVAAMAELAVEHVTEGSWESLPVPLHPRVLGVLRELGFPHMTPVQVCKADEKFNQLVHFLRNHKQEKHLVFFSTCACVEYCGKALEALVKGVNIMCIHGKMKYKRNKIFTEFRKLQSGILVCTDVMARGIDIPEVNWVLQYDPPSNASAFVHRCGRTARIGHGGSALVFLLPMEESYVNFLALNQKCPLQEMKVQKNTVDLLPKLKSMALADRAVFEKGMKAFVSYVQAYAKHECNLIFRLKGLCQG
ncbi:ATP-dependent RNA helicase DDX55, partial [Eschrichtius robustus]|nr:ATP-dependent RNA helicase DDX55 [Eschrichtius robustus]